MTLYEAFLASTRLQEYADQVMSVVQKEVVRACEAYIEEHHAEPFGRPHRQHWQTRNVALSVDRAAVVVHGYWRVPDEWGPELTTIYVPTHYLPRVGSPPAQLEMAI